MVHFDLLCLTWHSYIIRAFVEGTLRTFMGAIAAGCRKASSYRKVPKERDSGVRSSERTLDTPGKENDATIWLTKVLEIIRKSVFVQCLQSRISRMWAQVEDHRFGFCFFLFKGCRPCRRPRKRETGNGVSWLRSSVLWIVSLDALYIHYIYIYASNSIYLYVEVKFC